MSRRDDALDVGLRLFAEQGYAATTTAQIEAGMGLRPGAGGLYRHVGSKAELLRAAIERALGQRHDPPPGPFTSSGQALAAAVLHLVDADPDLWLLLLHDGPRLPLDLDDLYARLVQPAFDQAVDWARGTIGDSPAVRERVIVGISALLYLRVSQLTYGRTPAGTSEADFVRAVENLFMAGSGSDDR